MDDRRFESRLLLFRLDRQPVDGRTNGRTDRDCCRRIQKTSWDTFSSCVRACEGARKRKRERRDPSFCAAACARLCFGGGGGRGTVALATAHQSRLLPLPLDLLDMSSSSSSNNNNSSTFKELLFIPLPTPPPPPPPSIQFHRSPRLIHSSQSTRKKRADGRTELLSNVKQKKKEEKNSQE